MPLSFDKEPTLQPMRDGVAFRAHDGGMPITCKIIREALVGIAGSHPTDDRAGLVAIFLQHRAAIEAAAAAWYEINGEPVVLNSQAIAQRRHP